MCFPHFNKINQKYQLLVNFLKMAYGSYSSKCTLITVYNAVVTGVLLIENSREWNEIITQANCNWDQIPERNKWGKH